MKRFPVAFTIILCMVTTSCGPSQLLGPIHPPSPTSTLTTISTLPLTQTYTPSPTAFSTAVLSNKNAISAGDGYTCELTSVGGVRCWGFNLDGELGDGTHNDSPTPVDVSELKGGVIAISAGQEHTCALTSVGGVKCWGDNSFGQLGDGTTNSSNTPVDVSSLTSGVSAISAGDRYTCELTSVGGVRCWGENYSGELGDGTTTDRLMPVDVSGLTSGVTAISTDGLHTCALTSVGGVKCWGDNQFGDLGDGTTAERSTPVDVIGLSRGVMGISAGLEHTCALTSGGGVKCWGENYSGQLGDGTTTDRLTPVDVSGLTGGVIAISAGQEHTCALTSVGGVECWGGNSEGELGDGTTTSSKTPVDVSGLASGVRAISAGTSHTCALTSVGEVQCWGDNSKGELGNGTTTKPTPAATPSFQAEQSVTLTGLQMIDTSVGWGFDLILGSAGHILRTTDGGRSWMDVTPPNLPLTAGTFFLDAQSAWIYDSNNPEDYLVHTSDGGKTWTQLIQFLPTLPFGAAANIGGWEIMFVNEKDGWAESYWSNMSQETDVTLYGTSDSGATWNRIMLSDPPDATYPSNNPGDLGLCFPCIDQVYIDPMRMIVFYGDLPGEIPSGSAVDVSDVSLSTDLGKTWKDQTLPLPGPTFAGDRVSPLQPVFFNEKAGLLPFDIIYTSQNNPDGSQAEGLAVYVTHDGGLTWIPNPTVLGDVKPWTEDKVDFVSMQDIFAVCGSDLCATHDGAHTWQHLHANLNFDTDASAIDFVSPSIGWALKTKLDDSSSSLWETTNGGAIWTQLSPTVIP